MRNQKAPQTAREWLTKYRDRQILKGKKKQSVSPMEFDAMCIEFAEDLADDDDTEGDKALGHAMARHWVGLGYVVADEAVAA